MTQLTKIEWTDRSANPIRARRKDTGKVGWHCVMHSPGCAHCYSWRWNRRLGTGLDFNRLASDLVELFVDDRVFSAILSLRKPQRIFVCDMTDLFGEFVPDEMIVLTFALMAVAHRHTYQLLTKRADRLASLLRDPGFPARVGAAIDERIRPLIDGKIRGDWGLVSPTANALIRGRAESWPLPNIWLGVSVEDQARADERISHLLSTPAAVRFLSVEPLLGPIEFETHDRGYQVHWLTGERWSAAHATRPSRGIDWCIVGGESGPGARPMHPDWARSIRDQCVAAGVPFFFKQWGEWGPIGSHANKRILIESDGRWREYDAPAGVGRHARDGLATMYRVGKKAAGRVLDGRTWDEFPGEVPE